MSSGALEEETETFTHDLAVVEQVNTNGVAHADPSYTVAAGRTPGQGG